MYKVLVSCPPMLKMIDHFRDDFKKNELDFDVVETVQTLTEEDIKKILPKYDGWILGDDPANEEVLRVGKTGKLKAIVKWGVGTDNVNFDAAQNLNIKATNTPGMFGDEVSDLAISYLLILARKTTMIDQAVRKGDWFKAPGMSLNNKVLGIIGMGDIGKKTAKKAHALGLKIIAWDPYPKDIPNYVKVKKDWPNGLEICDFLIFACNLTNLNKHMFNAKLVNSVKKGINVINVSRGALIDENFIETLIKKEFLGGIGLDVFETEPPSLDSLLFSFPNSVFGSHNGSNTREAVIKASELSIKYMAQFLNE